VGNRDGPKYFGLSRISTSLSRPGGVSLAFRIGWKKKSFNHADAPLWVARHAPIVRTISI